MSNMNTAKNLSAEILGQISLMQSVVAQLPDKISILNFVCRGLTDVSGVDHVVYRTPEDEKTNEEKASDKGAASPRLFPIVHKNDRHATLIVYLSEPEKFLPYVPFIENFAQMIGVILEEQRQRKLNREIQADLEKMVLERTQELEIEIEAHRQSEEDLRQSEKKYRMLIENLPQRIFYKDKDSVYITCNQNYANDLGVAPDDIAGKTDYDFYPHDLAGKYQEDDRRIIKSGKGEELEETYIQAGKERIVMTVKTPVADALGRIIGILGIFWDITQQRRMEEQLRHSQKMESIGVLAGGVAHDFNNILGIILGNAELALDNVPDWYSARENLREIKTASLRAREVIRQLLSFSRKAQQTRKPMKLEPILKESLKLIRASIPATIEISMDLPEDSPAVLADPTQIHQIIINLCSNAAHAMPDGGVLSVALLTHEQPEDPTDFVDLPKGKFLQLVVQDTGEGMDPTIIDKIFDPYFTTKAVDKGTGLGLAVVHGIITNHNGGIYVSSKPGEGSIFTIMLPAIEAYSEKSEEAEKEPDGGKESILVVDDEHSLVKITRLMLEKLGYRVTAMTDPLDAMDLIASDPDRFDMVITDMTMPKMTGVELAEKIHGIRSDMPMLLCTGYNERVSQENALSFGFSGYIEKPVSKRILAQVVRKTLDRGTGSP